MSTPSFNTSSTSCSTSSLHAAHCSSVSLSHSAVVLSQLFINPFDINMKWVFFLSDKKSTVVFPNNSLALFPVFVSSISSTKLSKRPRAFKTMLYSPSKTAALSRLNPDCSSTCKKAFLERFFRQTYDENNHDFERK